MEKYFFEVICMFPKIGSTSRTELRRPDRLETRTKGINMEHVKQVGDGDCLLRCLSLEAKLFARYVDRLLNRVLRT